MKTNPNDGVAPWEKTKLMIPHGVMIKKETESSVTFAGDPKDVKPVSIGMPGLTKREYIATKALVALVSDPDVTAADIHSGGLAKLSVAAADTLIAELNKDPEES